MNYELEQNSREPRLVGYSACRYLGLAILIAITLPTHATTRSPGGVSLSSGSETSTTGSAVLERVDALSKKFGFTSFSGLTGNTKSVILRPGAMQAAVTAQGSAQSTTLTSDTNSASDTSAVSSEPPVMIQSRGMMQTPSGYIATAPLNGLSDGSYLVVHADGTVTANSFEGEVLWKHVSLDFTRWTGRYPTVRNGYETPSTPVVALGFDPVSPLRVAGEHPFAAGDLTADGVDDIAIGHYFQAVLAIDGYNNNNPSIGGTFVTVLDGRNGALVWSHMYPGFVANVAIQSATLVVANQTGNVQSQLGQNGSVSNLDAWQFSTPAGTTTATHAWTISTGTQWAYWLALEKLPNGKIAAAWTNSAMGSGNETNGTLLVASLASGTPDWSVPTAGYPRFLRYDSSRNQLVAIEQADPASTYAYSVVARNLSDGSIARTVPQDNATALNFQIGDLDGDGSNEWVAADLGYLPCTPVTCVGIQNSGRVLAINGTTGVTQWSQVRNGDLVNPNDPLNGSPSPRPYGLLLTPTPNGADVLVGSFLAQGAVELERLNGGLNLNGPGGAVLWSQSSPTAFLPLFMSPYEKGGARFVRVASSRAKLYGISQQIDGAGAEIVNNGRTAFQVIKSYDTSNGQVSDVLPLLGRIHAVAATSINGDDTTDLVVGGESGAVFALDGTRIDDRPIVLWRHAVAGPIHQIGAADLDGDGRDEIVVAATQAIEVLDSLTGNRRYEIPYATDYIWSFVLADLNNDGKTDFIVPGASSLTAYSGPNGSVLWRYAPSGSQAVGTLFSNAAITPDKIVTAQFAFGTQNPVTRTGSGFTRALVGINGATGSVMWTDSNENSSPTDSGMSSFPQFWHGTVAGQLDGIVGSVTGYSWVSYDSALDAFAPQMEIRNALTGTIIKSLPPPEFYNGSNGTLLMQGKGILSYAGNASWLLTPTASGQALGYDAPFDMVEANFGVLGRRVIEADGAFYFQVYGQGGIDITSWTSPVSHAVKYNDAVSVNRLYVHDLDGDGIDEVIRVPSDTDGNSALVQKIQGFGYEITSFSDGLDILEVLPASLRVTAVSRATDGHMTVEAIGAASTRYTVEASLDLSPDSFSPIGTVTSTPGGTIQFEDSAAADFPQRFYRFRAQE